MEIKNFENNAIIKSINAIPFFIRLFNKYNYKLIKNKIFLKK